ncbi:MAG: membrane protein insertion efficiency factor YidD [Phycisphaeraceae bacterium]|nr:membrane protein insertion efficiency factor YidD [Phycisphaeraceae bacterium]
MKTRGFSRLPAWSSLSSQGKRHVVLSFPLLVIIWMYQSSLSFVVGGQCRFRPTCSRYSFRALCDYGPVRGSMLSARRILSCRPGGRSGYDPVPVPKDA